MSLPPDSSRVESLALFPLGTVLVPGMELSLHVFEPRYRQLVADLLNGSSGGSPEFGVVALRQGWEVGDLKDVHEIGTTARVTDVRPMPDGSCNLMAIGARRFRILTVDTESQPYLVAQISYLAEAEGDVGPALVAAVRAASQQHLRALAAMGVRTEGMIEKASGNDDATGSLVADEALQAIRLPYLVARNPALPMVDRQLILAGATTAEQLRTCRSVLRREYQLLRYLRAIPANAATFTPGSASS